MDALAAGGPAPGGGFNPHLAFIGGNFTPPRRQPSALLTHRESARSFTNSGTSFTTPPPASRSPRAAA